MNVSRGGNEIVIFCKNSDITNVNIISKGGTVQNIFKKKKKKIKHILKQRLLLTTCKQSLINQLNP